MMSYATPSELRARLGATIFAEIYPEETDASPDLESSAAEIDGAIASRYRLPVTGERSLALLRDWTLTLTEERAYARAAGSTFAEKVKERVAQVRKYLDLIRAGGFKFPDAEERSEGSVAFATVREPVFGRENMKGF